VAHCSPVTREPVPRFDLYGELEVARSASVEVIEAAYRSLAKRHHPDVAASDASAAHDAERIKRLNVAREWLTDPERRRRYDAAMGFGPPSRASVRSSSSVRTARDRRPARGGRAATGAAAPAPAGSSGSAPPGGSAAAGSGDPASFGINGSEVRQFLADLRALDEARAQQVRTGRASVDEAAYTAARRTALDAGRERRADEARLAREAASVIVRGKLNDPELADVIAAIVADVAAAITLRDLLPRAEFELLLAPWTWRGGRISIRPAPAAAPAPSPTPAPRLTRPATLPARGRMTFPPHTPAIAAGAAVVVVIALAGGIALVNRPPTAIAEPGSPSPGPTVVVGGETETPTPTAVPTPSPAPGSAIDPVVLRELQRGAARTLRELSDAAAIGDVAAAKALLGRSAPGLRASGLAQASFPGATATDIAVVEDGDGWLATVGGDTLRTADGETWAFDYGDRPLAVYSGTPDHNLFWLDPRHDLFLRVDEVTVTRSVVRVRFAWSYGAGGFDGAFFDGASVWLSALSIGTRSYEVGPDINIGLGPVEDEADLAIPGTFRGASSLSFDAAVTLTEVGGGATIVSAYLLSAR